MGADIGVVVGFGLAGLACLLFPGYVARHSLVSHSPMYSRLVGVLCLGIAIFFLVYLLRGGV